MKTTTLTMTRVLTLALLGCAPAQPADHSGVPLADAQCAITHAGDLHDDGELLRYCQTAQEHAGDTLVIANTTRKAILDHGGTLR